jgi:gas vesicle protein
MGDGYDRFENESGGGGGFVMGLLTGTVLGAGLGMLFAPRAGSELRNQISEQAGTLANSASEGYRRASETAGDWADRGRQMYDKAKDAVSKGADEAQRYVRDTAGNLSGSSPATSSSATSGGSASTFGSSHSGESMRGDSTEHTRGTSPSRRS